MSITDIFSKRQKRIRGEVPDVYQYGIIPYELRVQVIQILNNLDDPVYVYKHIHEVLCREYGILSLGIGPRPNYAMLRHDFNYDAKSIQEFFLPGPDVEKALDVIELLCQQLDRLNSHEDINEINYRFREHGVGYQYESGKIIRIDSQFIHSEVVKPAMSMLSAKMYKGANAEFLSAHARYRSKQYGDCLNECLKAFESCMKAICDNRKWSYAEEDTASRLIKIIFEHGLISSFMQSHFSGLRSTLESGVPTARNRLAAHGQGSKKVNVPEHIAAYAIHLTASNILLLAKADEEMN